MYHARVTIEDVAASGALGDFAAIDVDMKNFFGSIEWEAIRDSYAEKFPEG